MKRRRLFKWDEKGWCKPLWLSSLVHPAGRFGGNFWKFEFSEGEGWGVRLPKPVYANIYSSFVTDREPIADKQTILTDKFNRLVEPGTDVCFVVVFDRNALVLIMVLEMIGAVSRYIDECRDAQHVQHVFTGSMVGTSEIQKREDFHRATLKKWAKTNH